MEIIDQIYRIRLNRLLRTTPGSLARGQAYFAGVCASWRRIICRAGTVYRVEDFGALLRLSGVFFDGNPATKAITHAMASSMKELVVQQRHSTRRPSSAFGPLTRILDISSSSLQTLIFSLQLSPEDRKLSKLESENDRSDWKVVVSKLVTLSKLETLQISGSILEVDDMLGSALLTTLSKRLLTRRRLFRSCEHLKSLRLLDNRSSICQIEEQDQLELFTSPSFILHHQLHTFDFTINTSVDALLVTKVLATGVSITRLRINYNLEASFTLEFATALAQVAPRLQEFHFNHPLDVDFSLEFIIPLLINCDSLHIDRPNIVSLPNSIDVLPSLQHISIETMGNQSIDAELNEMRGFLVSRKREITTVHLASLEDGTELAISRFLNGCEKAGFVVASFDPPEW